MCRRAVTGPRRLPLGAGIICEVSLRGASICGDAGEHLLELVDVVRAAAAERGRPEPGQDGESLWGSGAEKLPARGHTPLCHRIWAVDPDAPQQE